MKKKLIIRMLSMILCLALFATGCGSKQEENSNNITKTPATEKTDENNGSVKNDEKVEVTPEPTAEPVKKVDFAALAENTDRLVKEAIDQVNAGDYTPLSEPVKYNVLWLGYTHVTYGELDFQMTDFDKKYLQAVAINFEKSVESITNHNMDITVDLHFIDEATTLTKADNDEWLFLSKDTVQPAIDNFNATGEFDTVLTTVQTAGEENQARNEGKAGYGVNYVMLGIMTHNMNTPMGYSTFDLQKPYDGTYPLEDPEIPSLYATSVAVHEWMHQFEYLGQLLGIVYPPTHAYMGPDSYPGYQQYINGQNDYDYFEFYKLVLQGKLPYNDGSTVKYVGMYPKMWPLIKRNVYNLGKFVIENANGDGYLCGLDDEPRLYTSNVACIWTIKYLSDGRFMFSPEKMPDKLIDLGNAWDIEDNTISLWIYTGYLDAQSWRIKENSDGSYSLQTPYESGRLLTIRDPQGAFLASDGASGVQDWNIKPIEVEIMQ